MMEPTDLYHSAQHFFVIDEVSKSWVLKSASKKWRAFRFLLKNTYYSSDLSMPQNIANGCEERIPDDQWKWLVEYWKSDKYLASS